MGPSGVACLVVLLGLWGRSRGMSIGEEGPVGHPVVGPASSQREGKCESGEFCLSIRSARYLFIYYIFIFIDGKIRKVARSQLFKTELIPTDETISHLNGICLLFSFVGAGRSSPKSRERKEIEDHLFVDCRKIYRTSVRFSTKPTSIRERFSFRFGLGTSVSTGCNRNCD